MPLVLVLVYLGHNKKSVCERKYKQHTVELHFIK